MIKKKQSGYILLLTMIIISSLFLLVITIVQKTQIANLTVKTMLRKHEQHKYLANAIAILKDLLIIKKNEKNKNINEINNFFNFYWQYANRWLFYTIYNEKYDIDAKISLYITIEDGKFPLSFIFKEYTKEKDFNEENNEENNTNSDEYINNKEKKSIEKFSLDEITKKNKSLQEIKTIFEKIESSSKSNIQKLLNIKQNNNENNKKSKIWEKINLYMQNNKKEPFLLDDIFYNKPDKINIYQIEKLDDKNDTKKSGIYDLLSLENTKIAPLFLSPTLIEVFGQKEFKITDEVRTKIINSGNQLLNNNNSTITIEDFWKDVLEKNIGIPYPQEIFSNQEIKKIINENINYPQCISAIVNIELFNKNILSLIVFEKNQKYDKNNEECDNQNREYLIKSIYILPALY